MITGLEFIFIFQSVIIVFAIFIISHELFTQPMEPISLIFLIFGLVALQISNAILISLYDSFVIFGNSSILFFAPVIEEFAKFMIIIYLVVREEELKRTILHGLLVGLGFGIGELIGYTVVFGFSILLERSILLFFGHPILGGLMTYSIYVVMEANFTDNITIIYSILAICGIILLHIFWNFMSIFAEWAILLPAFTNVLLFYLVLNRIHLTNTSGLDESES